MGYNGSHDGKTRAFKADMFPNRMPKLIKGSRSSRKINIMPNAKELESFNSFFYEILDDCKDSRNDLAKKNVWIIYLLILIDTLFIIGTFVWESGLCFIFSTLLSIFLLANIWLISLFIIFMGTIIFAVL